MNYRLAYHYSCCDNERVHHAFRYAICASHSCFDLGNVALGVCYISLALRVAKTTIQFQKLLEVVEEIEATVQDANRAITDHIARLRLHITNQLHAKNNAAEKVTFTCSDKCIVS